MNLTEKEIGYICGLLDGEGSSIVNKHGYHRQMKDGTILLFFYHKIAIEVYNEKIMSWMHKKLNQIGIHHGYYNDKKRGSFRIHIVTKEDVDKFWSIFNRMQRLEPFESYIGCIIDNKKYDMPLSRERQNVLDAVKKNQPVGPTELGKLLHKCPSTIAEHLNHLKEDGLVNSHKNGVYFLMHLFQIF